MGSMFLLSGGGERQRKGMTISGFAQRLLGRRERALKTMRRMRTILEAGARFPLVHRRLGHTKALCQTGCAVGARGDLGAYGWRGAGIPVQGDHHDRTLSRSCEAHCSSSHNWLIIALAMNSG